MAVFNPLPATYQPNYAMYQQQYPQYQQAEQWQGTGSFAYVQGKVAAQAYQVPPGKSVLLMDTEDPKLYLKETDATGRPNKMVTWRLVEETEEAQDTAQAMTAEDIEKQIAEAVDRRVNEQLEAITDTLREEIAASFMPETKSRRKER